MDAATTEADTPVTSAGTGADTPGAAADTETVPRTGTPPRTGSDPVPGPDGADQARTEPAPALPETAATAPTTSGR
nr:hypothetical protein [Streptomyces lateritius]